MPTSEDFAGRVNYAAAVISKGARRSGCSRAFDSCFENHDGDEVCAVLVRRAESNPRLAENIWRYLSRDSVMPAVERLKDVPTRQMAAHAAETRARCRREFEAMMAARAAEQDAIRQRAVDSGYRVEAEAAHKFAAFRPDGSIVGSYWHEDSAWHFAGLDVAKIAA